MKKRWKKWMALSLAAIMTVSVAGCGDSTENPASKSNEVQESLDDEMEALKNPEFVYVPEYQEMPEDLGTYNQVLKDGIFYSINYDWDNENEKQTMSLVKYSLADGRTDKLELKQPEEEDSSLNIDSFQITSGGELIGVQNEWSLDEYTDEYTSTTSLVKLNAAGETTAKNDITSVLQEEGSGYVNQLCIDDKDNLYISADSAILLFGSDLKYQGKINITGGNYSYIQNMCKGKDGKVYASVMIGTENGSSVSLMELDFEGKAVGATYENFPVGNNSNGICVGTTYDFLVSDSSTLYGYSMEKQESSKVLGWIDSDINGQYVSFLTQTEDGNILAFVNDWESNENSIVSLKKTPSTEVVQKQIITIGSFYSDQELTSAAIRFNRQSDKYRVTFRTYYDNGNWSQDSYNDALNNMQNAIVSGSSPDLIELSALYIRLRDLAEKGALEDLKPYMDKSTKVKTEDYFPNLIEDYTYQNALVAMTKSFTVETVAGSSNKLGDKKGWTVREMLDFANQNKGKELYPYGTKQTMLTTILDFSEDEFIDWSTGECNFNKQEFMDVLEFANLFLAEYEYGGEGEPSEMTKLERGDLLLLPVYISEFQDLQPSLKALNNKVSFIGFPTADGVKGNILNPTNLFGISSKSQVKEGAWEFLEFYLSDYSNSSRYYRHGFPSDKKKFEEQAAKAMEIEYATDENGDYILDDDGNPIQINGGGGMSYGDGWTIEYKVPTQQEIDAIVSIIENSRPISGQNGEITKIIYEEAEGYFSGQKSVQDVADVIQRRVQMYVDENM